MNYISDIKHTVTIPKHNNSSLSRFLDPSTFNASGHVRVETSLQVADDNFPRIYAAGDLIDAGNIKTARSVFEQGQVVAQNIVRAIQGRQQVEYHQQWWEGMTKITVGLVRKRFLEQNHTNTFKRTKASSMPLMARPSG